MNDTFIDLAKDFVLRIGETYTIYKPEYPTLLFKGPYLEESEEYIKLTHLIGLAKEFKLTYIPIPVGIVKYYKMFKTHDENLNSRLDTISQEFFVFIYEADIHLNLIEERKLDKVPKFISQELHLEDLSKLANLKCSYRKPSTLQDNINNLLEIYPKEDKLRGEKILELLNYDIPDKLFFNLIFLVLLEISPGISPDNIYYMNLFDNNVSNPSDTNYDNPEFFEYLYGDINLEDISSETLHSYRISERIMGSNPKIFVDIEFENFDYKTLARIIKKGNFRLIKNLDSELEESEVGFYDMLRQDLQEISPNLPRFLTNRTRLILETLTNIYIEWRRKYGISTNLVTTKSTISEIESLKKLKLIKPLLMPYYPSFDFLFESKRKEQEIMRKIIYQNENYYSQGDIFILEGKNTHILYKPKYDMIFKGPLNLSKLIDDINLNILSKEFDIKCVKNYLNIYSFNDEIFLAYPIKEMGENLIALLQNSFNKKEDAIKLNENPEFNELVFDLAKLYILGINIDLSKIHYKDQFFGIEFEFGDEVGFLYQPLKGKPSTEYLVLSEYLRTNPDLQRRVAEFVIQFDIPDIDRKLMLRKKKLISILRNPSSNPTRPVQNYIGYVLPMEDKIGELFYSSANPLESRGYSGESISKILDKLEHYIIRGNLYSAIFKAFEVYSFVNIDKIDVVLKLYNRLLTIAMRTLSPESLIVQNYISWWIVFWVRNDVKVMNFDQDQNIENREVFLDKRINPDRLAKMISILCSAKKSSIVSRTWRVFMAADLNKFGIEKGLPENLTEEDRRLFRLNNKNFIFVKNLPGDDIVLICCAIYNRLRNKNLNVFSWIKSFIENYLNLLIDGAPSINMLWDMFGLFLDKSILEPIKEAYLADNRYWFLYSVVLNILFGKRDEMYNPEIFKSEYTLGEGLEDILSGECFIPNEFEKIEKIDINECGNNKIDAMYNSLSDMQKIDINIPN